MYSDLYSLPTKNVMILHLSASAHGRTQRTTRVGYMMLDVAPRQSSAFMSKDHKAEAATTFRTVGLCSLLATVPFLRREPWTGEWVDQALTGILPKRVMGRWAHHGLPPPFLVRSWMDGQSGQTWMESVTARKGTSMRGPRCLLTVTERLCMVDQR
jgi:hypothetical protein